MTWTRICWRIILILAWVFVHVLLLLRSFRICGRLLLLASLSLWHHSWLVRNLLWLLWIRVSYTSVWLLTKWIIRVLLLVVAVVLILLSVGCCKGSFFCLHVYLIAHILRVVMSRRLLYLPYRRFLSLWLVRLWRSCSSWLSATIKDQIISLLDRLPIIFRWLGLKNFSIVFVSYVRIMLILLRLSIHVLRLVRSWWLWCMRILLLLTIV